MPLKKSRKKAAKKNKKKAKQKAQKIAKQVGRAKAAPKHPLIIVSGFAGSGKSTLADSLGKKLGLKVVHASAILKEMREKGTDVNHESVKKTEDWWETEEAKKFMLERQKDSSLDLALDEKLREIARKGSVVLDSWTMGYLFEGGFKIWLNASPEERAKRVAERDGLDYNDVLAKIKARDAETKALYERLYNFRMGENLGKFNLALNTGNLAKKQVFEKAMEKLTE
ncbi:MAG: cytidylate kinase family protein [archaeon]